MEKNILSFSFRRVVWVGVGYSDLIKIGEPWRATLAASIQVPF
jgi:hypothetical protein